MYEKDAKRFSLRFPKKSKYANKEEKTKKNKKKFSQFYVRDKCEKSKFEGRIGFQGTHSMVFNFILLQSIQNIFLIQNIHFQILEC